MINNTLPEEMVYCILDNVNDLKDMVRLSRTNKNFNQFIKPLFECSSDKARFFWKCRSIYPLQLQWLLDNVGQGNLDFIDFVNSVSRFVDTYKFFSDNIKNFKTDFKKSPKDTLNQKYKKKKLFCFFPPAIASLVVKGRSYTNYLRNARLYTCYEKYKTESGFINLNIDCLNIGKNKDSKSMIKKFSKADANAIIKNFDNFDQKKLGCILEWSSIEIIEKIIPLLVKRNIKIDEILLATIGLGSSKRAEQVYQSLSDFCLKNKINFLHSLKKLDSDSRKKSFKHALGEAMAIDWLSQNLNTEDYLNSVERFAIQYRVLTAKFPKVNFVEAFAKDPINAFLLYRKLTVPILFMFPPAIVNLVKKNTQKSINFRTYLWWKQDRGLVLKKEDAKAILEGLQVLTRYDLNNIIHVPLDLFTEIFEIVTLEITDIHYLLRIQDSFPNKDYMLSVLQKYCLKHGIDIDEALFQTALSKTGSEPSMNLCNQREGVKRKWDDDWKDDEDPPIYKRQKRTV